MTMAPCHQELIAFAERLADAIGEVHRRYFRKPIGIELKADGTPVTKVDRAAERIARTLINEVYPSHGCIGEEYSPVNPDAELVWILDPLDGTKLFMMGIPQFASLVALAHRGRFVLGVIDQSILSERWVGADGHGTIFNGRVVRTRHCASIGNAVLCRPGVNDNTLDCDSAIDNAAREARWVHWGVTPYDYGLLASGFIDLIVTAGPKLHDVAALDPIIRNAGGAVIDWGGEELTLASTDRLLATGDKALIPQVLERLSR